MMRRIPLVLAAVAALTLALPSLARPQGALISFTGQLLDVRNGYVYFTTGDAFKLAASFKIADYDTGASTTLQPRPKLFARAVLDPATKEVVELDLTPRRLKAETAYAPAVQQAIATKPVSDRAPEIVGVPVTGKEVAVEFIVTVPPTTPIGADVYISTDAGGWNPMEIKLDRIDGSRYRAMRRLASGTKLALRVTRGSWTSVEVGEDGLEPKYPHTFFVREVDAQSYPITVYAWSDNRSGGPQAAQPGAVPTPFNPNPFGGNPLYPPSRATPPGGFPTPRPGAPPNRPPG
jgi:hypothetical protein